MTVGGSVQPDELGVRINVSGKTGPYSARLIDNSSWKPLLEWLEKHPEKNNPNSPLWIIRKRKITYDENDKKIVHIVNAPLNYKTYCNHWRMLQMRAGLRKIFPLHNLRRQSSISMLRAGYGSDVINANQGRKPNSKALSRYAIWNDAKTVDNAFLRQNGKAEKLPKNKLATKICGVCGEENTPDRDKCAKCLRPLDILEALKTAEENKVLFDENVAETIKETVRTTMTELYPDKKDELGQIFEEMDKHPREWFEKQVENNVEEMGAKRKLIALNYQPTNYAKKKSSSNEFSNYGKIFSMERTRRK
jgi:hypothetical protein